jgi:hypothetical protein
LFWRPRLSRDPFSHNVAVVRTLVAVATSVVAVVRISAVVAIFLAVARTTAVPLISVAAE